MAAKFTWASQKEKKSKMWKIPKIPKFCVTLLVTKGVRDKGNQGKYEVYAACCAVISPLSLTRLVSPATIHKSVAG